MKRCSIIIPAYNMENYIEKCLKSILNQINEEQDEIIVVDDGSIDKTLEICMKYHKKYKNIKVIEIENSGPSTARNIGIEEAKGKYMIFIDADDYIENDYISFMLEKIQKYSLVICGYNLINEKNIKKIYYSEKEEVLDKSQIIYIYEKKLLNALWNKIYITKVIKENNIKFNKRYYKGEDLLFILEYIAHIEGKIFVSNKILYNYELKQSGLNLKKDESLESKIERTNLIYDALIKVSNIENKRIAINVINMYNAHIRYYIKTNKIFNPIKIKKIINKSIDNQTFKKIIYANYNNDLQMRKLKEKYEKNKIIQLFMFNLKLL